MRRWNAIDGWESGRPRIAGPQSTGSRGRSHIPGDPPAASHQPPSRPQPPSLTEMVILSGEPPSRRLTASTLLNSVGAALMTASPAARSASMTPLMPGVLMSTMTLNDSPWGVGGEGEVRRPM